MFILFPSQTQPYFYYFKFNLVCVGGAMGLHTHLPWHLRGGERTALRSLFSSSAMDSGNPNQVIRLVQQTPVPTEPSPWPSP